MLKEADAGNSSAALRPSKPVRVVIVDDDRDTVLTLRTLLQDEGYEVIAAYNADQALSAARVQDVAAMILDIQLPDESGYTVAERVVGSFGEKRPLLIAISGRWTGQTDRLLGKMAGFDHYLAKPYDPAGLLRLLQDAKPHS